MKTLQAVLEHRSVDLLEHSKADFYPQVWADADDAAIECRMVQLAERQTAADSVV